MAERRPAHHRQCHAADRADADQMQGACPTDPTCERGREGQIPESQHRAGQMQAPEDRRVQRPKAAPACQPDQLRQSRDQGKRRDDEIGQADANRHRQQDGRGNTRPVGERICPGQPRIAACPAHGVECERGRHPTTDHRDHRRNPQQPHLQPNGRLSRPKSRPVQMDHKVARPDDRDQRQEHHILRFRAPRQLHRDLGGEHGQECEIKTGHEQRMHRT